MPRDHAYHALRVADVIDETADARSFVLDVPAALAERFAYNAGQFCTFRATIDGEPVARCYSMSSAPEAGEPLTVTVKRVVGGRMSNWMNDRLNPGDAIDVLGPSGLFVLREAEAPIVAFAGGSGITPILSIVKTALLTTKRTIVLVYANRDAQSVIFGKALEGLRATYGDRLRVHHHFDSEKGFLDAATCAELIGDRTAADFYVCGPGPFMDVVEAGLAQRGVGPERLFIERFEQAFEDGTEDGARDGARHADRDEARGEEIDEAEGEAASPAAGDAMQTTSLVVRIRGRKHEVAYGHGESILHAVRRAGLKPPSACEAGACGTCIALVVEGAATMRINNALDADEVERGYVLTCQAKPASREIEIDYEA